MNWQLWRQDDNGHRFLVDRYSRREEAETRMAELMQRHHKQAYWISSETDTPLGTTRELPNKTVD